MILLQRFICCILLLNILCAPACVHAQAVSYPLAGHLNRGEGTIEFWLRLEAEPDGNNQKEGRHHFPILMTQVPGEDSPRLELTYGVFLSRDYFHFIASHTARSRGKWVSNPRMLTQEETPRPIELDYIGPGKYPRTPRLHQGEWHHVAFTWKGVLAPWVTFYVDGKEVIRPVRFIQPLWDNLEPQNLNFLGSYYRDNISIDDLRISSVARTPEEIKQVVASGTTAADKYTLLLDRFEQFSEANDRKQTIAEVFCQGISEKGGWLPNPQSVAVVTGKNGQALKILR